MAFAALVPVIALAACSSEPDPPVAATESTASIASTTSTTLRDRPEIDAADLSEELSGGAGAFIAAGVERVVAEDYVEHEYVAAGTASSYRAVGELTSDGQWTLEADQRADYRTRILVHRPASAEDFSGTVLIEWLNVSGGVDADPDFATLQEEIDRQGHIWVGVSAQLIGVEGGPVLVTVGEAGEGIAGLGLRGIDPARYDSLHHPGDAFSYDMYSQIATAIRAGGPAVGDLPIERLIAVGESQSAAALVTYINGVQPLTEAFDGFFVHSRGGGALPLPAVGESADIVGSLGSTTTFRTDLDVPIFDLQMENDVVGVLGSIAARQPDSPLLRLWEVAGTAHADRHLVGDEMADSLDCGAEINDGPQHVVAKAGLRHLVEWVESGTPPPEAPRLEVTEGDNPQLLRDADGIVLGGIRTPPVDVPVQVLSGEPGSSPSVICLLLGSTRPLGADRLNELFASASEYEARYQAAADESVAAGFVLEEDRELLQSYAHPELVTP